MLKRLIRRNSKKEAKIYPSTEYTMNFDGASKGNPGLSGAGAVIYKNGEEIWSSCKFIGYKTNNQAEYSALILGLKGALTLNIKCLSVLGDSLLVINQVNNIYKVKSVCLHDLYKEAQSLKTEFDFIEFNHVYREYNKRADELSNLALVDSEKHPLQCEFIKELDEDWVEEIKIDNFIQQKHDSQTKLLVKIPTATSSATVRPKSKSKQSDITQFFKIDPLFPVI
jgi:ribonuclease HI